MILTQTIAESGRPRVADSVVDLHNLRQLSRMTTEKEQQIQQQKKHPETSSYKVQLLHALILTQTIAESGRPRVADLVVALHNLRQLSRMTTEKEQQIQQQKNIPKLHLTRSSSCTLRF